MTLKCSRGVRLPNTQVTVTPFIVTYKAWDTSGNMGRAQRLVEVYDSCVLPEFTCP